MINKHLAFLALDEDSPYTNSCLFTLDRLPLFSSPKTSQQSLRKPYRPLLLFNSPWYIVSHQYPWCTVPINLLSMLCVYTVYIVQLVSVVAKGLFITPNKTQVKINYIQYHIFINLENFAHYFSLITHARLREVQCYEPKMMIILNKSYTFQILE